MNTPVRAGRKVTMRWVAGVMTLVALSAVILLAFYGRLVGTRLSEHTETMFRPVSVPSRLIPEKSDRNDLSLPIAPARILPPDVRARATALQQVRPGSIERTFEQTLVAEHLISPDGLAIHPVTQLIYVSEEDASVITRMAPDGTVRVITRETPVWSTEHDERVQSRPLRFPEAIAFAPNGDLYVAEDYPGGRLIRFAMATNGDYPEGEVIPIPGGWSTYAWEGMDIGSDGEILLAGSDLEYVVMQDEIGVFTGAILYREADGSWWVPYKRFFASYSSVVFSKSGKQAVYTCEVTGEVGWIDLNSRYTLGGQSSLAARSPESVTVLSDGTFLIAEEAGHIIHLDPVSDHHQRIITGLQSIESVYWDAKHKRMLVTEDSTGRIWSFVPDIDFDPHVDMLMYATYYPAFSQQNIPAKCPDYLERILRAGGVRFGAPEAPVTFHEFLARVPLVAADVRAELMNPDRSVADAVERVQFVIFEPNRMTDPAEGLPAQAFALFGVQMASGELVTSRALPVVMLSAHAPMHEMIDHGRVTIAVPTASAVSVSGIGVAAVQFMGLGRTPDFSLVLNPRNPSDSYMVVFNVDGTRDHYRLHNAGERVQDHWVIAYRQIKHDAWVRLSAPSNETAGATSQWALSQAIRTGGMSR